MESVLARVATLEQAIANPASLLATAARTGGTAAPAQAALQPTAPASAPSFAEVLQNASTSAPTAGTAESDTPALGAPGAVAALAPTQGLLGTTGGGGPQIVRIAESQIGQTEQPPGSNESPAIAAVPHRHRRGGPGGAVVRVLRLVGRAPGGRAAGRQRRRVRGPPRRSARGRRAPAAQSPTDRA